MRYENADLREILAAEYVLGILHGGARRRFARLLIGDSALRRAVRAWESRLFPMNEALPQIEPPPRVWRAIQTRVEHQRRLRAPHPTRTGFWRALALASSMALLMMIAYFGFIAPPQAPAVSFALLSDEKAVPIMLLSSQPGKPATVKVKLLTPPIPAAGTALELWAIPATKDAPPVSLGLVSGAISQFIKLSEPAQRALHDAKAIAVSVEPEGGSPTGLPTGAVILQGGWLKL